MKRLLSLLLLPLVFAVVAAAEKPVEFKAHTAPTYGLTFSPDGKTLATAGFDNLVKLWDPATGKEQKVLTGSGGPVYCVVFHPEGKVLASSGNDGVIRLWNVADGKQTLEIKGHTGIVDSVA